MLNIDCVYTGYFYEIIKGSQKKIGFQKIKMADWHPHFYVTVEVTRCHLKIWLPFHINPSPNPPPHTQNNNNEW